MPLLAIHNLYWPLGLYAGLVVLLVGGTLVLSHVLGERRDRRGQVPYESGALPTGSNWPRLSVEFYLAALSFVILDVESVFLFAWAVALRESGLGWTAFAAACVFILLLGAALVYLWRFRAVDWGPRQVPPEPPPNDMPEDR